MSMTCTVRLTNVIGTQRGTLLGLGESLDSVPSIMDDAWLAVGIPDWFHQLRGGGRGKSCAQRYP